MLWFSSEVSRVATRARVYGGAMCPSRAPRRVAGCRHTSVARAAKFHRLVSCWVRLKYHTWLASTVTFPGRSTGERWEGSKREAGGGGGIVMRRGRLCCVRARRRAGHSAVSPWKRQGAASHQPLAREYPAFPRCLFSLSYWAVLVYKRFFAFSSLDVVLVCVSLSPRCFRWTRPSPIWSSKARASGRT